MKSRGFHTSLSYFVRVQSDHVIMSTTNITFSSLVWLRVPSLCDMGLWIAFLARIYAQIALNFPLSFKLHHFTFLHTIKSTTKDTDYFASLVKEAAKAQTGDLIAEGCIHSRHNTYCNLNLTIPVHVVTVKSHVNRFFNPTCVLVWVRRWINLTSSQSG